MSAKTLFSAILCTVFVFVFQLSYAQDKTVSGKVTDSKDGSPLSDASVQAKGTRTGTSTKADGTFSLIIGPNVTTLIISSVGYETKEVLVAGVTSVNVVLAVSTAADLKCSCGSRIWYSPQKGSYRFCAVRTGKRF
jgi:TonB-dependent starch-binding outer membrane protein SusC